MARKAATHEFLQFFFLSPFFKKKEKMKKTRWKEREMVFSVKMRKEKVVFDQSELIGNRLFYDIWTYIRKWIIKNQGIVEGERTDYIQRPASLMLTGQNN